jgi:hypothetical protein
MNRKMAAGLAGALVAGMFLGQAGPVQAQLGSILKGGGVVFLVDRFSGDIDRFVNTVTGNKTDNITQSTRVVPIVSVGRGTFVGAVQVSGPKQQVDQVKAVAQIEGQAKIGSAVRVRGLIPITTRTATDLGSLSRVKGVGVSALIDVQL